MKMKRKQGLLEEKLFLWEGKHWYHQRFDGAPYFLYFVGEAEIFTDREEKGPLAFTVHFCFFDNDKGDWYIYQKDINRVSRVIIDRLNQDSNYNKKLLARWEREESGFIAQCKNIEDTNLSVLSDGELLALHDKFVDIYLARFSSSSLIDGFALGTDELIAERVQTRYKKSSLAQDKKFSEVFSIVTAPIHLSFVQQAEKELYEIALQIESSPKDAELLVQRHQEKYFWLKNNYVDATVLPIQYFEEEIARIRSSGIDLRRQIEKIKAAPEKTRQKKNEYLDELDADKELRLLIKITEDFTHWQDERKKATFLATHYFSLFLREISKRVGISEALLKYLAPRDMEAVFDGDYTSDILREMQRHSVYYWGEGGFDSVCGERVDVIRKTLLGDVSLDDIQDFRGLTASLGKITGPVKILKSAKEIDKVVKGDVLVAVMTRPDYVPAMKRAAAIVTDEGGITSHAAIVSRELGIPCIIGTKIATKVLKDGDIVEVDAERGIVTKIKERNE